MKLSEAIREGAKLRPQGYGFYFGIHFDDEQLCSCALGAALESVYGNDAPSLAEMLGDNAVEEMFARFAINRLERFDNPARPGMRGPLWDVIIQLNDRQCWSREAIADWVESIGY